MTEKTIDNLIDACIVIGCTLVALLYKGIMHRIFSPDFFLAKNEEAKKNEETDNKNEKPVWYKIKVAALLIAVYAVLIFIGIKCIRLFL